VAGAVSEDPLDRWREAVTRTTGSGTTGAIRGETVPELIDLAYRGALDDDELDAELVLRLGLPTERALWAPSAPAGGAAGFRLGGPFYPVGPPPGPNVGVVGIRCT
jgi:hypothetical protein